MNAIKELYILSNPGPIFRFNLHRPQAIEHHNIIVACPNPPSEAVKAGKAIPIPRGKFKIDLILSQLPGEFVPDLVHLSARKMSFMPLGLERLSCPKVMKLGDTYQWGDGSLSDMIEYCQTLSCDYHWIYQGVQHLHFFKEAGLKNVFWLPGSIAIDYFVPRKSDTAQYDVCFRGSLMEVHIYRRQILNFLQDSGVNLSIARKSYSDSLEDYARSRIVLNCSGGGDTNRRIFEVLMAGGFLLTDRLSNQTGLQCLFQEGIHLECYGSPEELLSKIHYYLAHPEAARKIATAGQRQLIEQYHPSAIRQKLLDYVFQGELESPFLLEQDKRAELSSQIVDRKRLEKRLKIYELIQSIHHLNIRVKLLYWKCWDKYILSDLADLPRLEITCTATPSNFAEISSWCSQTEISPTVRLYQPELLPTENSFAMVLFDLSRQEEDVTPELMKIDLYLADNGLLLLTGEITNTAIARVDKIARLRNWKRVNLIEASSYQFIGVGFHVAYQKCTQERPQPSNTNLIIKTTKTLSLRERFKQKLNSVSFY